MTEPQPNDGFEWTQAPWGRVIRCRPLLGIADHFFTAAPLELRRDPEEWNQVAALAGVPRARLLLLQQVHGHAVAVAGRGETETWLPPQADAVVSNDSDAALVVRVADCAPLLLADARLGVAAAVHAGWRSTRERIASEAVQAMGREFGSDPGDLLAAIGPSLGGCCGEMGEEVVDAFRAGGHRDEALNRWFSRAPGRRPHFDLWRANSDQLQTAGVRPESIYISGLCTRTHSTVFHSYRAAGPHAGRMAAVIRPRGH